MTFLFNANRHKVVMFIIRWRGLEFFVEGISVSIWGCIPYNTMKTPHFLETLRAPCSFMNIGGETLYTLYPLVTSFTVPCRKDIRRVSSWTSCSSWGRVRSPLSQLRLHLLLAQGYLQFYGRYLLPLPCLFLHLPLSGVCLFLGVSHHLFHPSLLCILPRRGGASLRMILHRVVLSNGF